jgi:hypothetical protein
MVLIKILQFFFAICSNLEIEIDYLTNATTEITFFSLDIFLIDYNKFSIEKELDLILKTDQNLFLDYKNDFFIANQSIRLRLIV